MFICINLFNFLMGTPYQKVKHEKTKPRRDKRLLKKLKFFTCTTSSPLTTRPNTISLSFKSGIGAVVITSSNPLFSSLFFVVPSINASCFGLCVHRVRLRHQYEKKSNIPAKQRSFKKQTLSQVDYEASLLISNLQLLQVLGNLLP